MEIYVLVTYKGNLVLGEAKHQVTKGDIHRFMHKVATLQEEAEAGTSVGRARGSLRLTTVARRMGTGTLSEELQRLWPQPPAKLEVAFAADYGWDVPDKADKQTPRELAKLLKVHVVERSGQEYAFREYGAEA